MTNPTDTDIEKLALYDYTIRAWVDAKRASNGSMTEVDMLRHIVIGMHYEKLGLIKELVTYTIRFGHLK